MVTFAPSTAGGEVQTIDLSLQSGIIISSGHSMLPCVSVPLHIKPLMPPLTIQVLLTQIRRNTLKTNNI